MTGCYVGKQGGSDQGTTNGLLQENTIVILRWRRRRLARGIQLLIVLWRARAERGNACAKGLEKQDLLCREPPGALLCWQQSRVYRVYRTFEDESQCEKIKRIPCPSVLFTPRVI